MTKLKDVTWLNKGQIEFTDTESEKRMGVTWAFDGTGMMIYMSGETMILDPQEARILWRTIGEGLDVNE